MFIRLLNFLFTSLNGTLEALILIAYGFLDES